MCNWECATQLGGDREGPWVTEGWNQWSVDTAAK